jgi:hypothetical protein
MNVGRTPSFSAPSDPPQFSMKYAARMGVSVVTAEKTVSA